MKVVEANNALRPAFFDFYSKSGAGQTGRHQQIEIIDDWRRGEGFQNNFVFCLFANSSDLHKYADRVEVL